MTLVLEDHRRQLQSAAALDEDLPVGVDQDVVDRGILQQRLERAEADHLVDDVVGDLHLLALIQLHPLGLEQLGDQASDLLPERLERQLLDRGEVDLFQQALMQPHLDLGIDAIGGVHLRLSRIDRTVERRLGLDRLLGALAAGSGQPGEARQHSGHLHAASRFSASWVSLPICFSAPLPAWNLPIGTPWFAASENSR